MIGVDHSQVDDGLAVVDEELRHGLVPPVEARKLLHVDRLERKDQAQASLGHKVRKLTQVGVREVELERVVERDKLRALPHDGDHRPAGHLPRVVVDQDLQLPQIPERLFEIFDP